MGTRLFAVCCIMLIGSACGGADSPTDPGPGPTPTPSSTPASITPVSGGGETVRIGSAVSTRPSVKVTNASGGAISGIEVEFEITDGGGSITNASVATNTQGIAQAGSWTVGDTPGINRLTATVEGAPQLTASFTATARWPYWTVMVYMAADNSLTVPGILDIDEMEAAVADPEVQVLVQAEFNPTQLSLYGCDASCFNRPNFNTFRYRVGTGYSAVLGPDGPTEDIGNVDMTNPAELSAFIGWAKDEAPAEHFALVLWNHGGGYIGLLEDATSAGHSLMTMDELTSGLTGVGQLDIVDFDMCLMAGYETLESLYGLADYAVFSQENVPGAGNQYDTWLGVFRARAGDGPAAVASGLVDAFHSAYQGDSAPTTKSAYALSEYPAFRSAIGDLAAILATDVNAFQTSISGALAGAQKYTQRELTDFVTLLDSLAVRVADPTVLDAIQGARAAATNDNFRLRNQYRNGSEVGLGGSTDVRRSTGLHVVLPSGTGDDRFADAGPRSLSSYQALYPSLPWTEFVGEWVASQTAASYADQGLSPFQGFLVWDSASVRLDADVDLWVLEPNGNLYIPWLGSVTPNGTLTNDSYDDGTWFEGYFTNRYVESGRYHLYAHLWDDPNDHRPLYDLQYRYGASDPLTSLYAPDYPELSLTVSWLDDPEPTFGEVEADAYTDLRYVAYLDLGATATSSLRAPSPGGTPLLTPERRPTAHQLDRVRQAVEDGARERVTPRTGRRTTPPPTPLKVVPR